MTTKARAAAAVKPLSRGPRAGVIKTSAALTDHIGKFTTGRHVGLLRQIVRANIRQYDQLATRRPKSRTRGRGAPPKDEIVVLVSSLAAGFALYTRHRVTRNFAEQLPSPAEAFLRPILEDLGIRDPSGWIRKHIEARNKSSIYFPATRSGYPPKP